MEKQEIEIGSQKLYQLFGFKEFIQTLNQAKEYTLKKKRETAFAVAADKENEKILL